MTSGTCTVIYPVKDLAQAKKLYSTLLGVAPSNDEVYYVGFRVGNQDIGLDPHGHSKGMTGRSPTGTLRTSRRASSSSSTPARRRSKRSPMSVAVC